MYDNVQSVLKEKIDNHAKSSKTGKGLDIPLQKIISDSTVAVNTKTQKENEKDNRSKTKLTSIKQYHKKEDSSVKAAVKSSFDDRPKDEAAEVKTKATKSLFGKSFKESCAAKIAKNVANAKDSGDDSGKSRRNRKPGE